MRVLLSFFPVALLLFVPNVVLSAPNLQEAILITSPPIAHPTHCPTENLLRRQESCQYGQCGTLCLSQGAFCCGPAGSLATSPYWMCDNVSHTQAPFSYNTEVLRWQGACITSVRGTTGIVDCYDPDNPSGTTQSCLDNKPTATCNPTDRCYTCDLDVPFCRWETYIASNSATLRWFSCISSKASDLTFFAATITNNLPSPSSSSSPAPNHSHSSLSTGAIIGISVGVGIVILFLILLFAVFVYRKGKSGREQAQEQQVVYAPAFELDNTGKRNELQSPTVYSPESARAELQGDTRESWGRGDDAGYMIGWAR